MFMFMCLCAVYSITTFIRDMRTLLQIRHFAHLRSTTCRLQGLSSTQRSTHTTPSRDLTLGVKAREPPQTISPEVCSSPPGKTERRGTLSGGFATMCEGHRTHGTTTMGFSAPCCKPCCPVARAGSLEVLMSLMKVVYQCLPASSRG
jgi:hypothetical protein